MIVTIDGPAGAGKSSIARDVADSLSFEFLDTGAMYRAITLAAIRAGLDLDDIHDLVALAGDVELVWAGDRILLDGDDVSDLIRTPEVTAKIRFIADPPEIRHMLTRQQRRLARGRDIVTEGRDQGSEVFPDADCKIFLTASPAERARRRCQQLADMGKPMRYEDILAAQNQRDLEDRLRPVGRLRAAADAIVVKTDGKSPDCVRGEVLRIVHDCLSRMNVSG